MSQKVYDLVANILDGVQLIAVGCVTFCLDATTATAVNASILVAIPAIKQICKNFIKTEPAKVEEKKTVEKSK